MFFLERDRNVFLVLSLSFCIDVKKFVHSFEVVVFYVNYFEYSLRSINKRKIGNIVTRTSSKNGEGTNYIGARSILRYQLQYYIHQRIKVQSHTSHQNHHGRLKLYSLSSPISIYYNQNWKVTCREDDHKEEWPLWVGTLSFKFVQNELCANIII